MLNIFLCVYKVKDQQEAEKKKVASQEIQDQLAIQTKGIKEKKKFVLEDLAKVEPAVKDAQQGVMEIVAGKGLCRCLSLNRLGVKMKFLVQ